MHRTDAATTNGLLSAAGIIAASGLASRALGLLRDRLFAHRFGAGEVLDAYFAAYRIPDLLYNLLILGALASAFLPVVSQYLARGTAGRREAFRMANALIAVSVAGLSLIALVLMPLVPLLVPMLAPGFEGERRDLTILFTRIMLLQPILLGLSSVLGGMLLAFQRFAAYAAAPVLYNLGIIAGVVVLVPRLGTAGLAWGVVLGALLHVLVQLPGVFRLGFRFRTTFHLRHRGLRQVSHLFFPRLIGLLAGQVSALVVTFLGSGLLAGSIAAYLLAENLQAVPVGLFGVSVAVAAFPFLSTAAARRDVVDFTDTLVRSLRLVLFLALPASVFLLLLRAQIVRVVLGAGAFDWNDTVTTFSILGVLALSVVAQSIIPLLARAFFSLHDTRTPMIVSLLAIAANVSGAMLLTPVAGIVGLAWAFSLSSLLHLLLLLTVLHSRLGGLQDRMLLVSVARAGAATLASALAIQGPGVLLAGLPWDIALPWYLAAILGGLKGMIASVVNMQTFFGIALQLFGSLLGGVLVFLLVARLLGATELVLLRQVVRVTPRLPNATP